MSIYYHEAYTFEGLRLGRVLSFRGAIIHASYLTLDTFGNF